MKTLMNVGTLLEVLEKNKATHRNFFLEAQKGYKKALIERLEKELKAAREGKMMRSALYLTTPEDHTRDYDRAIAMVKHHQGDSIEIDEKSYAEFVLDDWQWKRQFITANSTYTASPYEQAGYDE